MKRFPSRFLSVTLSLFAALASLCQSAQVDAEKAAAAIDAILARGWEVNQLKPNPPVNDETFVRRAYLDIAGRIPTLQEARQFLDSAAPEKRAALIDQLLRSERHAKHMFQFWADILRVNSKANGGQGEMTAKPYVEHVKKRIRENQPYDKFVHELLTAQGKVWDNPAIGYYMRDLGMPLDNLANTSRIFLGTRLECAQCHSHPFDKWTQMQFYPDGGIYLSAGDEFHGNLAVERGLETRAEEREQNGHGALAASSVRQLGRFRALQQGASLGLAPDQAAPRLPVCRRQAEGQRGSGDNVRQCCEVFARCGHRQGVRRLGHFARKPEIHDGDRESTLEKGLWCRPDRTG